MAYLLHLRLRKLADGFEDFGLLPPDGPPPDAHGRRQSVLLDESRDRPLANGQDAATCLRLRNLVAPSSFIAVLLVCGSLHGNDLACPPWSSQVVP